ncbi:MAG: cell division protein FtsX [Pseudomonadales bacterium]
MKRSKRSLDPWPRVGGGPRGWLRDHARICSESLRELGARPATTLLVWMLIGIALALPAGLFLVRVNLEVLSGGWEGRPGLSVYLELAAPREVQENLAALLRLRPEVERVDIVSAEAALAEFKAYTDLAGVLDALPENPLPASLRVVLRPDSRAGALDDVAAVLHGESGVADVVLERTWLERVNDLSAALMRLGVLLGVLFGAGALLVASTAIQLAVAQRLAEIRVMRLVGATDAQMRRPLLYLGGLYGLGGGLMAAMWVSLALVLIETPLTRLAGSFGQALKVVAFDATFLLGLLGIGLALGMLGALVSAQRRLAALDDA